jgi:CheY-like chemotaxis protein
MAQRVLRGAGYSVLVAADGNEALELYRAHGDQIDLILLDVIMPGPDGKAVYKQVRLHNPTLPVLFCSGYSGGSISEHLVEDMPVNLLQKPFKTEELLFLVRELLDRAALMER